MFSYLELKLALLSEPPGDLRPRAVDANDLIQPAHGIMNRKNTDRLVRLTGIAFEKAPAPSRLPV